MASFLSALKSIGHVFGKVVTVADKLDPLISAIPVFGPIAVAVLNAITTVEGLIPTTGSGAAKKAIVTSAVNAQVPGINSMVLSSAIDAIVAAFNDLQTAVIALDPPAKT